MGALVLLLVLLTVELTTALPVAPAAGTGAGALNALLCPTILGMPSAACTNTTVAAVLSPDGRSTQLLPPPNPNGALPPFRFARLQGQLRSPQPGAAATLQLRALPSSDVGLLRIWVSDWKLIDTMPGESDDTQLGSASAPAPLSIDSWVNFTLPANASLRVRIDVTLSASPAAGDAPLLMLQWRPAWKVSEPEGPAAARNASFVAVPPAQLQPTVGALEWRHQAMVERLATGFNTWHRASALDHVHLPSAFGVSLDFVAGNRSQAVRTVDSCRDPALCRLRPGGRTLDGSYTQLLQRIPGWNVTVESAAVSADVAVLLLTVVAQTASDPLAINGSEPTTLSVTPSFNYFDCHNNPALACGSVTVVDKVSARADPVGLAPFRVALLSSPSPLVRHPPTAPAAVHLSDAPVLTLPLAASRICVVLAGSGPASPPPPSSVAECEAAVATQRSAYTAKLASDYRNATLREAAEALRAVVGWNTMFDQRIGVATPVGRAFGPAPYAIWLWDTYFVSLLSSESSPELAAANLAVVTRGFTVTGFVPGTQFPTTRANDRTKPFVGSLVTREIVRRYPDMLWIAELVFDELLAWNQWVSRERRDPETGLIMLGSNYARATQAQCCVRESAVWESGLDNSPVYDTGSFSDGLLSHLDVGQTAYFLRDCDDLMALGRMLGVANATLADLAQRRQQAAANLSAVLWSSERQAFLNFDRQAGRAVDRLIPNTFYPLLAGEASEAQALALVQQHLLSPQGFCVGAGVHRTPTPAGSSRDSSCTFLPSVAASDPAYHDNDYWRGRSWGPMNYLVFASLSHPRYRGLDEVQSARTALAEQTLQLLLGAWRSHGHVHENYNSETGVGCDVGHSYPFYTWGALNGLVAIAEAGLF